MSGVGDVLGGLSTPDEVRQKRAPAWRKNVRDTPAVRDKSLGTGGSVRDISATAMTSAERYRRWRAAHLDEARRRDRERKRRDRGRGQTQRVPSG